MENNKLFVGSLPPDLDSALLRKMFVKFGKITEAVVVINKQTEKSKGFGYVTFQKNKDARNAIKAMDQKEIEGKKMLVTFSKPEPKKYL